MEAIKLILKYFELVHWSVLAVTLTGLFIFKRKEFFSQFMNWSVFEKIWIVVFAIILVGVSLKWEDTYFGIYITLTGMLSVVLVAKGNIWNYYWGILNVTGYAYIAYISDYAGDFVLFSTYYTAMQCIGFLSWREKTSIIDRSSIRKNRRFKLKDWIITIIVLGGLTYTIGQAMPYITDALGMGDNPLPFADAFTSAGSIFAMYLMARRFKEQWDLWIVINIFSIYMWYTKGDMVMVAMWSAFSANAMYGYYNWSENLKVDRMKSR